jgi:hypothetical protein
MRNMKMFPPEEVPETLAGAEVQWRFESPLQEGQSASRRLSSWRRSSSSGLRLRWVCRLLRSISRRLSWMPFVARPRRATGSSQRSRSRKRIRSRRWSRCSSMLGMAQEVAGTAQMGGEAGKALAEAENAAQQQPGQAQGGGNLAPPPAVPALPPPGQGA